MGKFLGSFSTHGKAGAGVEAAGAGGGGGGAGTAAAGGKQASSRASSVCSSPVSMAPLTLGHQGAAQAAAAAAAAAKEQQYQQQQQHLQFPYPDVVTAEESDKLSAPLAIVSRLHTPSLSDTGKQRPGDHSMHGPLPEAQLQYSNLAGKMLRMVNELRATGADVSLELPTIVVCGQQSAGKSSVVENICGIPLPRAADTCTRCPTEVRLSQQPPSNGLLWEATVKLRREHSLGARTALFHQQSSTHRHPSHTGGIAHSNSGGKAGAGTGGMYPAIPGSPVAQYQQQQYNHQQQQQQPPSTPPLDQHHAHEAVGGDMHTLETVFRSGIARPEDLPAAVSAAQACLLGANNNNNSSMNKRGGMQHSPSMGHGSPLATAPADLSLKQAAAAEGNGSYPPGLKFSRDVVIVEVSGAPVDLTLIDLPGIIHNVERPEDSHYMGLVTSLCQDYMRRPGVVIVCTVTCTADIDTQGVLSMAREADPKGLRTLGVLTKPDQVEEGCHAQWLQVLHGKRYPLQLGWYVVKNPNQAALLRGTSSVAARQQEDMFFEGAAPWGRLPAEQRARLGTLRLREAMSKQLVKMAATARPTLMAAAQEQLVALRAELASLPPAAVLGDGHAELLRLIDDVSANIHEEVLARSQSKQFYQHLITLFQQLKTRFASSRPCFLLPRNAAGGSNSNNSANSNSGGLLAVSCALDDDLAHADEAYLAQQTVGLSPGGPDSAAQQNQQQPRNSEGGSTTPTAARLGSYNIFSGNNGSGGIAGSGKPGLGLFIAGGGGSSGSGGMPGAGGSYGPALVVAAAPHQVLLQTDSLEACRGLTLEDVRQLVERHHSIELPGFSPYSAVQELVSRHQSGWAAAAADCVGAAHRQLLHLVLLHVARTFSRFPAAADHIRDLATELLEELNSETTTAVESLVAMEMSGTLFAVSRREFSRASSQHLEGLRMLLAANLSGASAVPTVSSPAGSNTGGSTPPRSPAAGAGAADHGMGGGGGGYSPNPTQMSLVGAHGQVHTGLYDAALASQGIVLPPIPATATGTPELLSMMAAALTYYALACRRLSDTVSMSIMHHLVTAFTTRFRSRLATALLSLSSESVASMLVEDEASAARRASLTARKDMLEQAMKVMRAAM